MSVIITNNLDPNDVGTPSSGRLVFFSGLNNEFYYKKPNGDYFPIGNGGFNTNISLNNSTYDLTITDANGTLTASLLPLASGFYNTGASFSTSSSILTITDGFGSVTTSLSYFNNGFNQTLSYNTASNVLTLVDGFSTLTASLTTGGANNLMTFNPFTKILSVQDGFGTVTASLSPLVGPTGATGPQGATGSDANNLFVVGDGVGSTFRINSGTLSGTGSAIFSGTGNTASGDYSIIIGGINNIIDYCLNPSASIDPETYGQGNIIIGGGSNCIISKADDTASGYFYGFNTIGGGALNIAGSVLSGGFGLVGADTIVGGIDNSAIGGASTIGGGAGNISSGLFSVVSGGNENQSTSINSTIGGGACNISSGSYSTISGGVINTSSGLYSTIGGGLCNSSTGLFSGILGGYENSTNGMTGSFIIGIGITASCPCTTYVNCLSILDISSSSASMPVGTLYRDGDTIKIKI